MLGWTFDSLLSDYFMYIETYSVPVEQIEYIILQPFDYC